MDASLPGDQRWHADPRLARCLGGVAGGTGALPEHVRDELVTLAIERMRDLSQRMLKGFPQVRRWEDTDDVVQGAALRLHRSLGSVVPVDTRHFIGLAVLQIRRELLDLARKHSSPESFARNHETNAFRGGEDGPGKVELAVDRATPSADRLASWTRFHEVAAALPAEERELFDLVWYLGATQDDIGRLLGCSPRTIRRRWERTKARLLESLHERPDD